MEPVTAQSASSDSANSDTARTGILIIRAWMEEGSALPLRAHMCLMDDVSTGTKRTFTVCRPEEVVASVEAWLATMTKEADKPA